jgi:hypothetical protein
MGSWQCTIKRLFPVPSPGGAVAITGNVEMGAGMIEKLLSDFLPAYGEAVLSSTGVYSSAAVIKMLNDRVNVLAKCSRNKDIISLS